MLKKFLELKLKYLAKIILKKYKPKVVGITGSVGKSSAKDAVYAVLKSKFKARQNIKNYNNEIGLPLTIINKESAGKSIMGWVSIFWAALMLIIKKDKDYPNVLVLEMGVDRPGDMRYLTGITRVDTGLITMIGPSHLEYFDSVEAIRKEKGYLLKKIKKNGWAIANYDDENSKKFIEKKNLKLLSFGLGQGASVRAENLSFSFEKNRDIDNLRGIKFDLFYNDASAPVLLAKVIGMNSLYAALAAAAVGIAFDMSLEQIARSLQNLKSPRGRMNLVAGIKHTMLIDDTYNSSPQSSLSALDIVKKIPLRPGARKFAVLGDMLELGSYSEEGHKEVGRVLPESGVEKLILIGERARDIGRGALEAGMEKDDIFYFKNSEEAGIFAQNRIRENDLILIKGSQGARMEKITKELMAQPLYAKDILVRQDDEWLS